jgi:hypothetical protein
VVARDNSQVTESKHSASKGAAEPPLEWHFSSRARGGAVASKIDHQDAVAAILSIDAVAGRVTAVPPIRQAHDVVVFCEGLEDLEFAWASGRLLVSVKDLVLTMPVVRDFLLGAEDRYPPPEEPNQQRLLLCGLRGADSKVISFEADLTHLKARLAKGRDTEAARSEFERKWNIPAINATKMSLDLRPMLRDSSEGFAIFANAMRLAFPVTNCTDRFLLKIWHELQDDVFAKTRRHREAVSLRDLNERLASRLAPDTIVQFQTTFVSTPFGYFEDPSRREMLKSEARVVSRARRKALRTWRRHTLLERLTPRIRCLVCEHPMMGGFNGRSGYVCPDCGYFPFVTLFYACECATPVTLLTQPELSGVSMFSTAIAITREEERRCPSCQALVDPRRLDTRLFMLRIPAVLNGSVDARLMAMREAFGRPQKSFSPTEARTRMLDLKNSCEDVPAVLTADMPRFASGTLFWLFLSAIIVAILLMEIVAKLS